MNRKYNILFVIHDLNYANFVPIGVASLIGTLEFYQHTIKLICPENEDVIAVMDSFQPDIVAYSVLTGSHSKYLKTNSWLKSKYDFISVFGGPHPTFFPEIIEETGVDVVCVGEGDITFVDFLEKIGTSELKEARNLWIKMDGVIYRNPVRPYIKSLDEIPLPNYEIFYQKFANLSENPIKHFLIGRGCPYNCTYCFNHSLHQIYNDNVNRIRYKSPTYIIDELKSVTEKFHTECIYFRDDIFVSKNTWLEEFIPLYKNEIGLPFICQLRIEMINERLIRKLISAGCVSVSLGVETGNEKLRREVLNRPMSNTRIVAACDILKEQKMPFCVNNMVGIPGETLTDLFETLELTQRLGPSYSWFQIFQPYPKTRLAEYAKEMNLFNVSYDKISQTCHERTALEFSHTYKRQINNAHKLFALAVEWPHLTKIFKWLITLPENKVFIILFAIGQYYFTTRRLFPMLKLSVRDWVIGFWRTIMVTQPMLRKR